MQASIVEEPNKLVLRVSGDMSFTDNKDWRRLVEQMLEKDSSKYVLDVTGLEMVDSAGLGMMLTMKQWAEDQDKQIALRYDDNSFVGNMIKLAKFNDMFVPDVD